jgi:hypothetical protein
MFNAYRSDDENEYFAPGHFFYVRLQLSRALRAQAAKRFGTFSAENGSFFYDNRHLADDPDCDLFIGGDPDAAA